MRREQTRCGHSDGLHVVRHKGVLSLIFRKDGILLRRSGWGSISERCTLLQNCHWSRLFPFMRRSTRQMTWQATDVAFCSFILSWRWNTWKRVAYVWFLLMNSKLKCSANFSSHLVYTANQPLYYFLQVSKTLIWREIERAVYCILASNLIRVTKNHGEGRDKLDGDSCKREWIPGQRFETF